MLALQKEKQSTVLFFVAVVVAVVVECVCVCLSAQMNRFDDVDVRRHCVHIDEEMSDKLMLTQIQ